MSKLTLYSLLNATSDRDDLKVVQTNLKATYKYRNLQSDRN